MKTKILFIIILAVALGIFAFEQHSTPPQSSHQAHKDVWYCPMHPWIKSDKPGVCPICGMALVKAIHDLDKDAQEQPNQPPVSEVPGYVPVSISTYKQQLIGVRTAIVSKKTVIKTIRSTGSISTDSSMLGNWVKAQVFEDDLPFIHVGQQVMVDIPDYGLQYNGIIRSIANTIDAKSRTIEVMIEIRQRLRGNQLKGNMFVNVEVPVEFKDAVAVPREAVMDTGLRKMVFVEKVEGTFEPRVIYTGWKTDNAYEVKFGLKEGERIVVSGNFLLDSESRLQADLQEDGNGQ